MGRSSFYFTHGYKGNSKQKGKIKELTGIHSNPKTGKKSFIETRLNYLLEKYKNDKEIREDILGELQLYRLNLTMAREYNDKTTEKNLTEKFIQFLKQF